MPRLIKRKLLLLLLLSCFSCVRLYATPWMAAHQAHLVPGILQARTLEWGAIAFSDGGTSLCNSLGFHYGIWLDTLEEKGISNDFHSALSTIMAHNHMSQSHSVDIASF